MQMRLAAGAGKKLRLDGQRVEEVVHPLSRLVRVKPRPESRVLRRHANRATARVAVIAITGLGPDLFRVVGFRNVLVAVERHHRRMANRDGICSKGNSLRHVGPVPDTTSIDQCDVTPLAEIVDGLPRLADRRNTRHARVFGRKVRACARAAFHTVDIDRIRVAFHRHPDVVIDAACTEFELDRDLTAGRFADLQDLQRQIVGAQPVGVTGGRPLVDTGWQAERISATWSVTF